MNIPTMLSIEETAKQANVSKNFIRQCCLQKKITFVRPGKRYLINFEKFIEFLNNGEQGNTAKETEVKGKVRKIN